MMIGDKLCNCQSTQRHSRSHSLLMRSSYMTISERVCGMVTPLIGVVQALIFGLACCFEYRKPTQKLSFSYHELVSISKNSLITVNEVEALLELFKKLSSSVFDDGLIHKEELHLALLQTPPRLSNNLLLDRLFDVFDEKKNGVIEFEEFVRVLSVFHPQAPIEDKIDFTFRLYDVRQTGYIEPEGVRKMLNTIFSESGMEISEENLEAIIERTFADADFDKDGKISRNEWKEFVLQNPTLLENMTLPYLKDITMTFSSFIFDTEVDD